MDPKESQGQRILEEIQKHKEKRRLQRDPVRFQEFAGEITDSVNIQLANGVRYFKYIAAAGFDALKDRHNFSSEMAALDDKAAQNPPRLDLRFGRGEISEDEEMRSPLLYMKLPQDAGWDRVRGLKGLFRRDARGTLCFAAQITEEAYIMIPCYCYLEELTPAIVELLCSCRQCMAIAGEYDCGLFSVKGIHISGDAPKTVEGMEVPLCLSDRFLQVLINAAAERLNLSREFSAPRFDRSQFTLEELYYLYRVEKIVYSPALQSFIERGCRKLFDRNADRDSVANRQLQDALTLLLTIDWKQYVFDPLSPDQIKKELDARFYGMQRVKRQILEVLAHIQNTGTLPKRGILLHGPVGTGKKSLAGAIADILGLPIAFIELSMLDGGKSLRGTAGICSDGEPGLILRQMLEHKTANMVIVLNDIDKAADPDFWRKLLDNGEYWDNYIKARIPAEGILFVAACHEIGPVNQLLRDKFYQIDMPAYSKTEKERIFDGYIYPKLLENAHVWDNEIQITPAAKSILLQEYAAGPGADDLERCAQKIMDYHILQTEGYDMAGAELAEYDAPGADTQTVVDEECLRSILGPVKSGAGHPVTEPGTVVSGFIKDGAVNTFVLQVLVSPGRGDLRMINIDGPCQKGFCQIAFECVRARFSRQMEQRDIIVSADRPLRDLPQNFIGYAACAAMISALTKRIYPAKSLFWGGCDLRGALYTDDIEIDPLVRFADGKYKSVYASAGTSLMADDTLTQGKAIFVEYPDIDAFLKALPDKG